MMPTDAPTFAPSEDGEGGEAVRAVRAARVASPPTSSLWALRARGSHAAVSPAHLRAAARAAA